MINRKKAMVLVSVIEFLLVALAMLLFFEGWVGQIALMAFIVVIATVSSTVILFILRRLPPE